MVIRSLLSKHLREVQAEGSGSSRARMWNELGVFKAMEESEYHRSKGSEGKRQEMRGGRQAAASY